MDLIELTLRGVTVVCMLFLACGFGSLACDGLSRAIEAGQKALEGIDG